VSELEMKFAARAHYAPRHTIYLQRDDIVVAVVLVIAKSPCSSGGSEVHQHE
jgi:hypothetical protein